MLASQSDARFSARAARLLGGAFFLTCLLPFLMTFRSVVVSGGAMSDEQIALPSSLKESIRWPGRFRHFFKEHFGLRQELIALHGHIKVDGFGVTSNPKVLLGKGDWLYLAAEGTLDYSRGRNLFQEDELQEWTQGLAQRSSWLKSRGMRFLVVAAPNKHTIYPEHLPDSVADALKPRTRLDQLLEGVSPQVELLDLRPVMRKAKERYRVFHRTDTHWNLVAGKLAGEMVARWWDKRELVDDALFDAGDLVSRRRQAGDLARMLGLNQARFEEDLVPADYLRARSPDGTPIDDNHLDVRGTPLIISENPAGKGRVVAFSDSFGQAMVPWLAVHFQRVVWVRSYEFDSELVLKERPDVVMQQFVERKLQTIGFDGKPLED